MNKGPFMNKDITDRYVRNKLSPSAVEEYEVRMLESPELQKELEEALLLQRALESDEQVTGLTRTERSELSRYSHWKSVALAASFFLAVISLVLFLDSRGTTNALRRQLDELTQPRTQVLHVPVPIMRSANSTIPDVIVQLPDGYSIIMLDIELGTKSRTAPTLTFILNNDDRAPVLTWTAKPKTDGKSTVALNSEQISAGQSWLIISSAAGEELERRLLEFRDSL